MSNSTTSVIINRTLKDKKQTLGVLSVLVGNKVIYNCKTLELPWLNNTPRQSCIPVASYQVLKRNSPKYGDHFHIQNVPNRELILIHQANYVSQLLGCIAVGSAHSDINGDGLRDVINSKLTMKMLISLLPNKFNLDIN